MMHKNGPSDHEDEEKKMVMPTDQQDKNSPDVPPQHHASGNATIESRPSRKNVFQQRKRPVSESIIDQSKNPPSSEDNMGESSRARRQAQLKNDTMKTSDCVDSSVSSVAVETNRISGSGDAANTLDIRQAETIDDVIPSDIGSTIADPLNNRFSFPVKLHDILSKPDFQHIICWLSHGKSWLVLRPKKLEQEVLRKYFRHGKFSSFTRQVNGWGFKRIVSGADQNAYYHEMFVRDNPRLCLSMKRKYGANESSDVLVPSPPPAGAGPSMGQAYLGLQTQSQDAMSSFTVPGGPLLDPSNQMAYSQYLMRNRSDSAIDNSTQEVGLHQLQSPSNHSNGGNLHIENQNSLSAAQTPGNANSGIVGMGNFSLLHNTSVLPSNDPNMSARLYETRLLALDALLNAERANAARLTSRPSLGVPRVQPMTAPINLLQLSANALSSSQAYGVLHGTQNYASLYALRNQLQALSGCNPGGGPTEISQAINVAQHPSSVAAYGAVENIQHFQNSFQDPNDRPIDQANTSGVAGEITSVRSPRKSEDEEF